MSKKKSKEDTSAKSEAKEIPLEEGVELERIPGSVMKAEKAPEDEVSDEPTAKLVDDETEDGELPVIEAEPVSIPEQEDVPVQETPAEAESIVDIDDLPEIVEDPNTKVEALPVMKLSPREAKEMARAAETVAVPGSVTPLRGIAAKYITHDAAVRIANALENISAELTLLNRVLLRDDLQVLATQFHRDEAVTRLLDLVPTSLIREHLLKQR